MYLWHEFRQPSSISEAIEDLVTAPSPAVPIAGGTDLLLDMRQGRHEPAQTLIDLTKVPEMNLIEIRAGFLFIGACVSINRIISNPIVQENAQALVEACNLIAGPQIRNIATLGGNVAHALPAADGTIAMVALNAEAEIANPDGILKVHFKDLFLGPGKSAIDKSSELITGFYVPLIGKNQASAFNRIMCPQGVALPILNCAVWVERSEDVIKDVRISVGPGGPVPFRATNAETFLREKEYDDALLNQAVKHILLQGSFRTSPRRATSEYRKHILADLFKSTFIEAWQRASV
jgi:carbon-monoxide dehydrogenase medium subunit